MTQTRMKVGNGVYREGEVSLPKRGLNLERFKPLLGGLAMLVALGGAGTVIASGCKSCTQERTRRDQAERTAIEQAIRRIDCVERTQDNRFQLRVGSVRLPIDQRPRTREDLQNCQTVNVRSGDSYRDEVHCLPKEGIETQLRRLEFGSGTFQVEPIRMIEINGVVELKFGRYGANNGISVYRQIRICPQ